MINMEGNGLNNYDGTLTTGATLPRANQGLILSSESYKQSSAQWI